MGQILDLLRGEVEICRTIPACLANGQPPSAARSIALTKPIFCDGVRARKKPGN
jgi:hypothetical protein